MRDREDPARFHVEPAPETWLANTWRLTISTPAIEEYLYFTRHELRELLLAIADGLNRAGEPV